MRENMDRDFDVMGPTCYEKSVSKYVSEKIRLCVFSI